MNWLNRLPLSAIVRLFGAVILCGAVYLAVKSGLRPGWFETPSIALGCVSGPGLLLYRRWARLPGMLYFGVWLALGFIILFAGSHPSKGLSLIVPALCALPTLWMWSDDGVASPR